MLSLIKQNTFKGQLITLIITHTLNSLKTKFKLTKKSCIKTLKLTV